MNARIFAIGEPSTFRQQVASAASTAPESIGWLPNGAQVESILGTGERADVIVISPHMDHDDVLALVQMAARFSPTTAVVVMRKGALNGSVPSFMRAGARDVVDTDAGPDELKEALERAISWASRLKTARTDEGGPGGIVVSVFSSKGGTGKTFLACNLAAAIAESVQQDTALVDLDLAMGDVFSYWGKEPTHPIQDLMALGRMVDREAMLEIGTPLTEHLWGFGAPPDPAAETIDPDVIATVLQALKSNFAFTVVDGAAGYSDQALPAFDTADAVCLVAGLDVVGIKHLSKALETLASIGVPRENLLVVLNRADSKVGIDVEDVERLLNVKIDSMIPSSRDVPVSLNQGHPIYLAEPHSHVSVAIRLLAERIISLSGVAVTAGVSAGESTKKRKLFRRT